MEKTEGKFEVIDSFAIRARNEFYLIGKVKEGVAKEQSFVNVALNSSFFITFRISKIEEVEMAGAKGDKYTLLIVASSQEDIDMSLALNIGNELLDITADGAD